ncbi:MAG: MraY family glycosyltransferase [Bacillota bacterium]|nr:MraY family glycosyltransferase [Bacillota bacterium]
MSTSNLTYAVVSAFVIAYFSMPLVIRFAHRIGAIDQPDPRKVHQNAMPRLGGLAIFTAFLISMLFIVKVSGPFTGIILGGIIIFLVGMLDDVFQLSPWVKLIGQCIAAVVAMHFGVMVHFVTNPFDGMLGLGYLSLPITFLWIVGITNAINLIDGLDGLAAGVSAIAAATMGVVAFLQGQHMVFITAMVLVAAIAGFLPYNFHPARTFMGDSGSNFLGFVLGCLAIAGMAKSAAIISLFVPIVILGIPIFDTSFAIIRRIHNKAPIFMPDKAHLHHRLMAIGLSHRKAVLCIYGISGFFGGVAIILTKINNPKAMLVLAVLLLVVVIGAEKIGMRTGESKQVKRQTVEQGR